VIVTDANEVVEKMHDRMPVIIQAKDYDRRLTADPNRSPIDLPRLLFTAAVGGSTDSNGDAVVSSLNAGTYSVRASIP
jgi:putative SOS response-associated peptidase YedK